jgi:hypothetical protein
MTVATGVIFGGIMMIWMANLLIFFGKHTKSFCTSFYD